MYQRGQQILIEPHIYANGSVITQVIIDNVYDWGVRGFTYAKLIGVEDKEEGMSRIHIRVDWDDILGILHTPRRYDYYYPDLDGRSCD